MFPISLVQRQIIFVRPYNAAIQYQIVKEAMALLDVQLTSGENLIAESGGRGLHERRN